MGLGLEVAADSRELPSWYSGRNHVVKDFVYFASVAQVHAELPRVLTMEQDRGEQPPGPHSYFF